MKKKLSILLGMCLLTFFGSSLVTPISSYAEVKENEVGIQFTEDSTAITTPSSDVPQQEPTVNKPITKTIGTLPSTGELMQPLMLLLVGWLVVIVGMSIFLSSKKIDKKEG